MESVEKEPASAAAPTIGVSLAMRRAGAALIAWSLEAGSSDDEQLAELVYTAMEKQRCEELGPMARGCPQTP